MLFKVWIKLDENNKVLDPYKSLPKPHADHDDSFELIGEIDEINKQNDIGKSDYLFKKIYLNIQKNHLT